MPVGGCGMRGGKIGLMMLLVIVIGIGGVFFVYDQHLAYSALFGLYVDCTSDARGTRYCISKQKGVGNGKMRMEYEYQ